MGLLDTYLMRFDEHGSLRMSTDRFAWVLLKQHPWCLDLLWSKTNQLWQKKRKTWNTNDVQKWRNVNTHTLTHTDETSIYELCKLLLSFLLQCVTAVETRECLCFIGAKSQTQQRCLALWRYRTHVTVCTKQRSWSPISLPSSFLLSLSLLWCSLNILALSEVHREQQKSTSSATCLISETLVSVSLLLTAHALLAASSFTVTLLSVHAGLFHIIRRDAKQDRTTKSGECRWVCFGDGGCRGGCYSSLWRTGGSSLCDRAVRTLSNFS